jgi:hypothetical protein
MNPPILSYSALLIQLQSLCSFRLSPTVRWAQTKECSSDDEPHSLAGASNNKSASPWPGVWGSPASSIVYFLA